MSVSETNRLRSAAYLSVTSGVVSLLLTALWAGLWLNAARLPSEHWLFTALAVSGFAAPLCGSLSLLASGVLFRLLPAVRVDGLFVVGVVMQFISLGPFLFLAVAMLAAGGLG